MSSKQTHDSGRKHKKKRSDATLFKIKALNSIERRKKMDKYGKWVLLVIAIMMAIYTILIYMID